MTLAETNDEGWLAMAATAHTGEEGRVSEDPGGWEAEAEGVPAGGARRVQRRVRGRGSLCRSPQIHWVFCGPPHRSRVALFLAVPAGPAAATGSTGSHAKTIKVSTAKVHGIGTVLTTAAGLTLYWFKEDKPGTSTCTGACAKIWPPLLASKGAHVSGPHGVKGLSLMNVGNGHWQVAFHELPLYRFEGDKKKGQAHGQNVGGVWFAVLKSGLPASATGGTAGTSTTTSTTAAGATTTQPATSTPQRSSSNSSPGANVTTPTQAPTPATMPTPAVTPTTQATQATPTTSPPPPSTTPPTPPPTTTPTTSAGGGGYGY